MNVSALARIWELRIFLILGGSCSKRHLVHVRLTLGSRGYFFIFQFLILGISPGYARLAQRK